MNCLLRHSSNIHIGMFRRSQRWEWIGILWNNIKAGYIFTTSAFTNTGSAVIGLIKNIKL